jgi:hypothetical protein
MPASALKQTTLQDQGHHTYCTVSIQCIMNLISPVISPPYQGSIWHKQEYRAGRTNRTNRSQSRARREGHFEARYPVLYSAQYTVHHGTIKCDLSGKQTGSIWQTEGSKREGHGGGTSTTLFELGPNKGLLAGGAPARAQRWCLRTAALNHRVHCCACSGILERWCCDRCSYHQRRACTCALVSESPPVPGTYMSTKPGPWTGWSSTRYRIQCWGSGSGMRVGPPC